jgi:two-component system sensor histidine kinase PilS (NtrC family)
LVKGKSLLYSIGMMRLIVLATFYFIFQIVIILQKPFLQNNFIFNFYLGVIILFLLHFIQFSLKIKTNILFRFLDIAAILLLYKAQPLFSSFYLLTILVLLFLSGLDLKFSENIFLVFLTSVLISLSNLFFLKWTGIQNILNLGLFNIAFIAVLFFSTQLKSELVGLTESLDQTKLKLKSKAELSQILIENMPVGLMAMNAENNMVFYNSVLQNQLNLNPAAVSDLLKLKLNSHTEDIVYYNSEINDKRIYQIESASYFDPDYQENINLHLIKDTTEIRRLQDQIKHKEKMAAVGQLAAGIAHEIRNPLAGISGSIELLSQDTKNPDDQKLMRIILKEIDRLNNLITEFLDYSKPEKRPDQKVDLALVLNDVLENIKLSSATPSEMTYQIYIQSSYVLGISDQLKQAFLNIIVNAIQAMKNQKSLVLGVKTASLDNNQVYVEISDTGSGMSEETQKRLFEPFYTTKSKGTGLGLAMTHKIFEAHQATIQIESKLDFGTKFKIIFNKINT